MDRLRAGGREAPAEELLELEGTSDELDGSTRRWRCTRRMKQLPEHCAEILDRFFARDESYRAIGEALDIPPGTIASRISRCLRKTRGQLEGRNERFRPSDELTDGLRRNPMTHTRDTTRNAWLQLLKMLPPAPEGWVRAAQELPQARLEIDEIAERAQADAEFRAAVEADLEAGAHAGRLRRGPEPAPRAARPAHRLLAAGPPGR